MDIVKSCLLFDVEKISMMMRYVKKGQFRFEFVPFLYGGDANNY